MPLFKADDLKNNPPVQEPSIIGPGLLLHNGMMMLVGQTESGKSVLALDIAFSLALKEDLFRARRKRHGEDNETPYYPVHKACKVLYLDSEIGPVGMHERLKKFYQERSPDVNLEDYLQIVSGDSDPLLIHETRSDNGAAYKNLRGIIGDIKPGVAIFDHLGDFHLFDEDSNLMRIILKGLRHLQHEFGFAAIVLHHESDKQIFTAQGQIVEKSGTGRQRGHSSIAQTVDTLLGIRRESNTSNQTFLKLDWLKTRHCRKPKAGWVFTDLERMKVKWFGPTNHTTPAQRKQFLDNYKKENKISEIDD